MLHFSEKIFSMVVEFFFAQRVPIKKKMLIFVVDEGASLDRPKSDVSVARRPISLLQVEVTAKYLSAGIGLVNAVLQYCYRFNTFRIGNTPFYSTL